MSVAISVRRQTALLFFAVLLLSLLLTLAVSGGWNASQVQQQLQALKLC